MNFKLQINVMTGKNKKALTTAVIKKWNKALYGAAVEVDQVLKRGLVYESVLGLSAFSSTNLWNFLMLPETLAELGFITTDPLTVDLLGNLSNTIFVKVGGGKVKNMTINIFDMQFMAKATIHRSAGTGQLGDVSWFVDWIIKGVPVNDYRFKETGPPAPRSSRLSGSRAGLMIEGGLWQFPPQFRDAVDEWLQSNIGAMKTLVETSIRKQIGKV